MSAIVLINAAAVAAIVAAVVRAPFSAAQTPRSVLLFGLAVGFEEVARNIARLRKRLVDTGYFDTTSVWYLAAAVSLPISHAMAGCVAFRVWFWFRHQRRVGRLAYRETFSTSAHVLTVGASAFAIHASAAMSGDAPTSLASVLVGMATFILVNRVLVFGMICVASSTFNPATLVGRMADNALELSTLALGGLTGLAVAQQPALAVLAVLPTYAFQRGALVHELEVAASHDAKTGLLNALAWQTLAKRELSRAERENHPATVLIIDLDHFKRVNDRWGHVAGDAVIKAVGQCLREELRDYDTVGRFGGEEFVAILPDVDEFQGAVIAERLRRRVAEVKISSIAHITTNPTLAAASDQTLSTSIGVACFPDHGGELDQLLIGADSALYRAKDRGRNRVEFASGPDPEARELIAD